MDNHLSAVIEKRIARTVAALQKNGFDARSLPGRDELFRVLDGLLPPGTSCSVGGSMTLAELGVLDYLKRRDLNYYDRYAEGADIPAVYHQALGCQVYLMSSNAVTEDGKLYNIDGNGNRVAALVYGPEKVVVIAGANKIVPDLEAARLRKAKTAAPANAMRLNKQEIPCYHTGECSDCSSPGRFCNMELVTHRCGIPGRITVLLLSEDLGY